MTCCTAIKIIHSEMNFSIVILYICVKTNFFCSLMKIFFQCNIPMCVILDYDIFYKNKISGKVLSICFLPIVFYCEHSIFFLILCLASKHYCYIEKEWTLFHFLMYLAITQLNNLQHACYRRIWKILSHKKLWHKTNLKIYNLHPREFYYTCNLKNDNVLINF